MNPNRSNRVVFETAVLLTLCGLILSATLATIVQMDKEMIATETATQPGNLLTSHH